MLQNNTRWLLYCWRISINISLNNKDHNIVKRYWGQFLLILICRHWAILELLWQPQSLFVYITNKTVCKVLFFTFALSFPDFNYESVKWKEKKLLSWRLIHFISLPTEYIILFSTDIVKLCCMIWKVFILLNLSSSTASWF